LPRATSRKCRWKFSNAEEEHTERRRIIQLFAAAATSLWAKQQLPASALLQTFVPASGIGEASNRSAPASQDSPPPEPLLPLFPLRLVLLPHANLALHIFEERYKEMIQDCLRNQWEFGVLLVGEESVEDVGCTASISKVVRRYPDGRMDILVRGRRRFEMSQPNQEKSYLRGKPQFFEDDASEPAAEDLRQQAIQLYNHLMKLNESEDPSSQESLEESLKESLKGSGPTVSDPQLSFQIMADLPADLDWKQGLLELRSERERLVRVIRYLRQLVDYLERTPDQPAPAGTV